MVFQKGDSKRWRHYVGWCWQKMTCHLFSDDVFFSGSEFRSSLHSVPTFSLPFTPVLSDPEWCFDLQKIPIRETIRKCHCFMHELILCSFSQWYVSLYCHRNAEYYRTGLVEYSVPSDLCLYITCKETSSASAQQENSLWKHELPSVTVNREAKCLETGNKLSGIIKRG